MGRRFYGVTVITIGITTFLFSAPTVGGGLLSLAAIGSGFTKLIF
jgi:hypothetical protein